jgi:hypothetical protein
MMASANNSAGELCHTDHDHFVSEQRRCFRSCNIAYNILVMWIQSHDLSATGILFLLVTKGSGTLLPGTHNSVK